VTTALAPTPLTAADRCDRCGAQAYLRAILPSGRELVFCAHHGKELRDSLELAGASVHDETERLRETPATAALDER
jgi:hypothetical protein